MCLACHLGAIGAIGRVQVSDEHHDTHGFFPQGYVANAPTVDRAMDHERSTPFYLLKTNGGSFAEENSALLSSI
jgi:hypothetical protein